MTWSRRQFSAALGFTPFLACDRGPRSARKEAVKEPTVAPTVTEPAVAAPLPGPVPDAEPTMHYQPAGPDYLLADGPAPFSFDGDELLEIREGILIRRDAALTETSRIPLLDVTNFAVLPDRSLVVRVTPAAGPPRLHHVIAGRSKASYNSHGRISAATEDPNEIWVVDTHSVSREEFGTDKLAGLLVPNVAHTLPQSMTPAFAALPDGTIAVSSISEILHADATKLSSYTTWIGGSDHLAPGPGPRTLWASNNNSLALVTLEGTEAKLIVRHALRSDEVLLHLAGSGNYAAAVIGRTFENAPTQFALAVYTTKSEQWRVPLPGPRQLFYAAVSATRVVVRSNPPYLLRAWDLATGKPA